MSPTHQDIELKMIDGKDNCKEQVDKCKGYKILARTTVANTLINVLNMLQVKTTIDNMSTGKSLYVSLHAKSVRSVRSY